MNRPRPLARSDGHALRARRKGLVRRTPTRGVSVTAAASVRLAGGGHGSQPSVALVQGDRRRPARRASPGAAAGDQGLPRGTRLRSIRRGRTSGRPPGRRPSPAVRPRRGSETRPTARSVCRRIRFRWSLSIDPGGLNTSTKGVAHSSCPYVLTRVTQRHARRVDCVSQGRY
jgi:hypothetical protein